LFPLLSLLWNHHSSLLLRFFIIGETCNEGTITTDLSISNSFTAPAVWRFLKPKVLFYLTSLLFLFIVHHETWWWKRVYHYISAYLCVYMLPEEIPHQTRIWCAMTSIPSRFFPIHFHLLVQRISD
jgi:hypothetical protein